MDLCGLLSSSQDPSYFKSNRISVIFTLFVYVVTQEMNMIVMEQKKIILKFLMETETRKFLLACVLCQLYQGTAVR